MHRTEYFTIKSKLENFVSLQCSYIVRPCFIYYKYYETVDWNSNSHPLFST